MKVGAEGSGEHDDLVFAVAVPRDPFRRFTSSIGGELFSIQKAKAPSFERSSRCVLRLDDGCHHGRLRRLLGCFVPSQLGPAYQT
jgi:hypothetical protein